MADPPPNGKRPRGFAAMDPKLVAEIARMGGVAAHRNGAAHEFTSDEARAAGRKGGLEVWRRKREREAKQKQEEKE